MQASSPLPSVSPIEVPKVDSDEPVVVIPVASVAPLDDQPGGERITTFRVAPRNSDQAGATGVLRDRVLDRPFTYVAAAFSLGFVLARLLR
jgi:hypothetical protein